MTGQKKTPPERALAGEVQEGFDEAQALPKRVDRYALARGRAVSMLDHIRTQSKALDAGNSRYQQMTKQAAGLSQCGEYLHFRHYYSVGKVRLHRASFCKQHLLCPLCAIRRGAKSLKAYLDRYRVVQEERPGLTASLVTLTVKNGPELLERFDHLRGNIARLNERRRQYLASGRGYTEWAKALGAVGSVEFTNKGKGWHPHAHYIVLHEEPISQRKLAAEWEAITGDSFIVDVRPIEQEEPEKGFIEVFKYALKFSDLSLSDNYEAAALLKGKRLLSSFGLFWGVQVPESMTDEQLDDLPYIDLFYSYRGRRGYELTGMSDKMLPGNEKGNDDGERQDRPRHPRPNAPGRAGAPEEGSPPDQSRAPAALPPENQGCTARPPAIAGRRRASGPPLGDAREPESGP